MLFSPPFLKQGDLVLILSTARVATIEDVADAVELLESWGLRVKLGSTIGRVCNQFAGTDEERANDLQQALDCSETKAIFCARGGYGTNRILDRISFSGFMKHPKWVIGFSDVTFLHLHFNFMLGVRTIHSFMAALTKKTSQAAKEALRSILFGEKVSYHFNPHPLNKTGRATAMLCGGNLSILYASIGTQLVINSAGSILFLEDIDEYLYHIDRMMWSLEKAGKLKHISALVAGGFTDIKDNTTPYGKTAEEIIVEYSSKYPYPVCFGAPAGHIEDNRPLVLGATYQLNIHEEGTDLILV